MAYSDRQMGFCRNHWRTHKALLYSTYCPACADGLPTYVEMVRKASLGNATAAELEALKELTEQIVSSEFR
jgi:NADH:ubiquinone oxidoreductase subunit F (NADH-binding)